MPFSWLHFNIASGPACPLVNLWTLYKPQANQLQFTLASAVSTDRGDKPTINSINDSFSQTKTSYNNATAAAESIVAGTFSRSMHCTVKLVTCTWQSFSFSTSLRRAVLSLRGSLCKRHRNSSQSCNAIAASSSQIPHAKTEKGTAGSYSPAARAASPSAAAPCPGLVSSSQALTKWGFSELGSCAWCRAAGRAQEHGWAGGTALCQPQPGCTATLTPFPSPTPLSSQQILGILFSKIRNLRHLNGVSLDQAFFFSAAREEVFSFSSKALL